MDVVIFYGILVNGIICLMCGLEYIFEEREKRKRKKK